MILIEYAMHSMHIIITLHHIPYTFPRLRLCLRRYDRNEARALVIPGDIMLGGLFPMHEQVGQDDCKQNMTKHLF